MIDLESIIAKLDVAQQKKDWESVNADLVFKDIPALIDEVKRQTAEIASIIAERDTEKTRANKAEAERDSLIKDFTNYAKGGTTDPSPYCVNKAECIADDGWCILERCDFRPNACETRTELNNGSDYHIENPLPPSLTRTSGGNVMREMSCANGAEDTMKHTMEPATDAGERRRNNESQGNKGR